VLLHCSTTQHYIAAVGCRAGSRSSGCVKQLQSYDHHVSYQLCYALCLAHVTTECG
jgi:hypothetical protein